jgi:hypothetical protein
MKLFSLWLALLLPVAAFSWGGRAHHSICEAAVFLVKEPGLKNYLQSRPQIMGHLCNIPDTYWRSLGSEVGKQGNSTHFIDTEFLGIKTQEIPLDYQKIISKYTGKENAFNGKTLYSIPLEFGSNWWRADQFFRRAVNMSKDWKKAPAPANSKEEQDDNHPFNKMAFDFFVNLGLMGHFVADNGQPFHLTADYDGYKAGHGGIHAFYEDTVVGALPFHLTTMVVEEGLRLQKLAESKNKEEQKQVQFLREKTVLEKMRTLGQAAFDEIPAVLALDPVKKPSVDKNEKGMSLRTPAEREPAETVAAKYEKLVVSQLARSSALLAQLWDEAYVKVGRPKLASYKSYRYPHTPDFVPPDYFDLKLLEKKTP